MNNAVRRRERKRAAKAATETAQAPDVDDARFASFEKLRDDNKKLNDELAAAIVARDQLMDMLNAILEMSQEHRIVIPKNVVTAATRGPIDVTPPTGGRDYWIVSKHVPGKPPVTTKDRARSAGLIVP